MGRHWIYILIGDLLPMGQGGVYELPRLLHELDLLVVVVVAREVEYVA